MFKITYGAKDLGTADSAEQARTILRTEHDRPGEYRAKVASGKCPCSLTEARLSEITDDTKQWVAGDWADSLWMVERIAGPAPAPQAPPVADAEVNAAAVFEGPSGEAGGTPALMVGGTPVHVYVKGGCLVVSVHCDTGDTLPQLLDTDGNVRLEITVNGSTVFKHEG